MRVPRRFSDIAVTVLLIAASFSASANMTVYGGAGAGNAKLKSTENDRIIQADAGLLTSTSSSKKDADIGYKIFVEGDFNKYVALEVGYYNLGEQNWKLAGNDAGYAVAEKVTYSTTGLGLSVLGRLPATDRFNVFGRLGLFSWRAEVNAITTVDGVLDSAYNYNDTGVGSLLGLGAEYKFMKALGLRAEWERFAVGKKGNSGKADIDLFSLSVLFRFK